MIVIIVALLTALLAIARMRLEALDLALYIACYSVSACSLGFYWVRCAVLCPSPADHGLPCSGPALAMLRPAAPRAVPLCRQAHAAAVQGAASVAWAGGEGASTALRTRKSFLHTRHPSRRPCPPPLPAAPACHQALTPTGLAALPSISAEMSYLMPMAASVAFAAALPVTFLVVPLPAGRQVRGGAAAFSLPPSASLQPGSL